MWTDLSIAAVVTYTVDSLMTPMSVTYPARVMVLTLIMVLALIQVVSAAEYVAAWTCLQLSAITTVEAQTREELLAVSAGVIMMVSTQMAGADVTAARETREHSNSYSNNNSNNTLNV